MAYEKPPCTFNQIDKAGKAFFDEKLSVDERGAAVSTIWNWRIAHSYPLNALHTTLRNRALKIEPKALTAQRLKRLPSILRKLGRQTTMQMSQMQDIGGCRVILANIPRLNRLRFTYETEPLRHDLVRVRDYIDDPKDDGYRSIHLMYRFRGKASSLPWDKLRIEVQMRTKLQHAWATSVETVDAFTGEDLKFGKGASKWRRFFQLMGSMHARMEKTAEVPNTPSTHESLCRDIKHLSNELQVVRVLEDYAKITKHITDRAKEDDWYIIRMYPDEQKVTVQGFAIKQLPIAERLYAEAEKEFQGTKNQAALVATESVTELKKAYPNFFADTTFFISTLQKFLRA